MLVKEGNPLTNSNPEVRRGGVIHLRLSRRWIAIIAVAFTVSWLLVFALGARLFPDSHSERRSGAPAVSSRPAAAGPWGELTVVPLTLEPPSDFASRFLVYDSSTWYFRDCDRTMLPDKLRLVGFPESMIPHVINSAVDHPAIRGLSVKPDHQILFGLSDEQRERLYRLLADEPANYSKTDPFRFRRDAVERWFERSGLNDETIRLVRRMLYYRGDIAIFSDVSAVIQSLSMETEKVALFRALAGQSAQHVTLHIRPNSDVNALAQYWGRGNRAHEIRPLLESLANVPGGSSIGITDLLPSFARRKVYQYPAANGSSPNSSQDCHWTSMNFWNEVPDDRFSDPNYVAQKIASDYMIVSPGESRQFGDVLFLTRSGDQAIHSAVYIADDIVFTKNGGTITSPWMLMRMSNMIAYYSIHGPVEVRVYRKTW